MRFAAPTKNAIPAAEASRSAKNSATWSSRRAGSALRPQPGTCSTARSVVASPMQQRMIWPSAVQRSR